MVRLACAERGVSMLFKVLRESNPIRANLAKRINKVPALCALRPPAGEEAVPGGTAYRLLAIRSAEDHTLLPKPVDAGGEHERLVEQGCLRPSNPVTSSEVRASAEAASSEQRAARCRISVPAQILRGVCVVSPAFTLAEGHPRLS